MTRVLLIGEDEETFFNNDKRSQSRQNGLKGRRRMSIVMVEEIINEMELEKIEIREYTF